MNFKKKVNGSWHDIPHYVHNTSTDTITTLPAVIYPNDTTATVGLKGQTVQSGTPTPDNPIMPEGTGERAAQLWDISSWDGATATRGNVEEVENRFRITALSNDAYTNTYGRGNPQCSYKVLSGETYTLSWEVDNPNIYGQVYVFSGETVDGSVLTNVVASRKKVSFTVPSGHNYIAFRLGVSSSGDSITYSNIMLNTGSTALPYEPYGIKIPISSANTTTNIYLGEVETTRQIRKLVLTGEENIREYDSTYNRFSIIIPGSLIIGVRLSPAICSHYQAITDGRGIANVPNNAIYSDTNTGNGRWFIKTTYYTTAADFKSYLATQYAAGTPVTVWYVLATEETAVVNEPLMKIGEYADEISGISIPVTAGGDTLSVDTTVQPSEVTVNYKGWHPAIVHERTNGAWT